MTVASRTQALDPAQYAKLPTFAQYEGENPRLRHLLGTFIPTRRVEDLIPVGDREAVVVNVDGAPVYPWKGVWITEYDAAGNVVTDGYGPGVDPIPELLPGPKPLDRAEMASLGYTDDSLAAALKIAVGDVYIPDRVGPSQVRRAAFDKLMTALGI